MSQTNETNEEKTNMERLREDASACGPGCSCHTGGSGRARWIVGAIVIVLAGVLVARAAMKDGGVQAQSASAEFAMTQSAGAASAVVNAPAPEAKDMAETNETDDLAKASASATLQDTEGPKTDGPVVCGELIQSLGDLNQKAMDKDGVFVFLAGLDATKNREIASVVEKGAKTLQGRNIKMGTFTLESGSSEFTNLSMQVSPPCVLAMVKGRGALAVSDDITEAKLMQAFVTAANAGGGCGPSGCGPSSAGCN